MKNANIGLLAASAICGQPFVPCIFNMLPLDADYRHFYRGYFFMILFMAFLNESRPETWRELGCTANYEEFVKQRPVFRTIECVFSRFVR